MGVRIKVCLCETEQKSAGSFTGVGSVYLVNHTVNYF